MAQLRRDYARFVERDAEVVVVGPDDARAFADYWRVNDLPFVGLPDPDVGVLQLYRQEFNLFRLGRMPAQVVIDKRGIMRFVHYGKSMSDIPGSDELLALLDGLNREDSQVAIQSNPSNHSNT